MADLQHILQHDRIQYDKGILSPDTLEADPLKQFTNWMQQAIDSGVPEPNAMNLCTVNSESKPSSRIVLLKGVDARGLMFYSNYISRKGKEIDQNPYVSVSFFWQPIARQIRVEGHCVKLSESESDQYFASRPRESQLGAWASQQSSTLTSRTELEQQLQMFTDKFKDTEVPRPSHWGGYLIQPHLIEYWQGRPDRLHDRFVYELSGNAWKISRLSP